MNKKGRGIVKWMPFNSITDQKYIIDNIIKEKSKISKPNLSSEQIEQIENKIIEAFYEQIEITIYYYKNGYILNTNSKIYNIDYVYRKIFLNNNQKLLFNQILKIEK